MGKIVWASALVVVAAGLSGCASVTRGWEDAVTIESEPSGATVTTTKINPVVGQNTGGVSSDRSYAPIAQDETAAADVQAGPSCVTPCALKLPRRDEVRATISKPGYKPQTVDIRTQVSTGGGLGMAGNVVLGGVVGAVVDAGSGAMLDHVPNPVHVTLEPVAKPAPVRRRPRGKPVS